MSNQRKIYTEAQNISLISQVNRICPICTEPLFYKKNNKTYKNYELAHIYPLNPTSEEKSLLANEERLSEDVNDENNIIPLCEICHNKFDKPRTIKEYRELYKLKKRIIEKSNQESIWKSYKIEEEISEIIDAIYHLTEPDRCLEIEFESKIVDQKLDSTITSPTRWKIKRNVEDYYIFIRNKFRELDKVEVDTSEIISLQIKTYYVKQKKLGFTQQIIYENIVDWLMAKTKPKTTDAAEILVSFFIQNCEVF